MYFVNTKVNEVYDYYYKFPENINMFNEELMFSDYLVNGNDSIILALIDKKIIGFCLLNEISKGIWVKEAVSVHSEHQRKGIATKMLFMAHKFVTDLNGKMRLSKYSKSGQEYLHKINMQYSDSYDKL